MQAEQEVIKATQYWLLETVIGFNFCPFAKKEYVKETIDYKVSPSLKIEDALYEFLDLVEKMHSDSNIETALLIFEKGFNKFEDYLDLLDFSNQLIEKEGYEGIFQVASFHPNYVFDGVEEDDASNYTNRSPYPVLHLLREESLEKALAKVENPEEIPERNIQLAKEKGREVFERILEKAFHQ